MTTRRSPGHLLVRLPDSAEKAGLLIGDFLAARWEAVRADFDARMQQVCSAELLASVRAQLVEELGELLRARRPGITVRGPYTVVDVPLIFARGARKARVTLDGEGRVAGFFVLMPEA